jgi:hypothetical protein
MANLRVGNFVVDAGNVVKLGADKVADAMRNASRNDVDDVFFKVGNEHFVASKAYLASSVREGQEVEFEGRKGLVERVDRQDGPFRLLGASFAGAALGGILAAPFGAAPLGANLGWLAGAATVQLTRHPNPDLMNVFRD